jgi:hypothetical protein
MRRGSIVEDIEDIEANSDLPESSRAWIELKNATYRKQELSAGPHDRAYVEAHFDVIDALERYRAAVEADLKQAEEEAAEA